MVGVVICRAMGNDQVWPEAADQADHPTAIFKAVIQLAVGWIEDLVGSADDGGRSVGLAPAALGQCRSVLRLMAGLAVGQAHQLHLVPEGTPLGSSPARFDVGVIGMGPDHEDSQRLLGHDATSVDSLSEN